MLVRVTKEQNAEDQLANKEMESVDDDDAKVRSMWKKLRFE